MILRSPGLGPSCNFNGSGTDATAVNADATLLRGSLQGDSGALVQFCPSGSGVMVRVNTRIRFLSDSISVELLDTCGDEDKQANAEAD